MAKTVRPYPPLGFECAYKDCCPHLNRISTAWVFREYRRIETNRAQLWRIIEEQDLQLKEANQRIAALEKEKAQVQAKYLAVHQRQFKAATARAVARKSGPQTGHEDAGGLGGEGGCAARRKRGAPKGHPGWSRPRPDTFDRIIEVPAPSRCPHCLHEGLEASAGVIERWQEDIIIVTRPVSTLYRYATAYCPPCQKQVHQTAQDQDQSPAGHIGPVAKSTAIYLHHAIGISYRKAQRLMEDLFGMKFATASALAFDEHATRKGEPLYEDLRDKLRTTPYIHADETHWRQDGKNAYAWFFGNQDLAFSHIDRSRSGNVAAAILGDAYPGVLVADGYQGYNAVNPMDRQSCLAHLVRKCDAVTAEIQNLQRAQEHQDALDWCAQVRALLGRACAMDPKDTPSRNAHQNVLLEQVLLAQLEHLCQHPLSHPTAETFRMRLLGKEKNQWFSFLRHPGVPPTNNHAEQSIRQIVIQRKTSFGTRSEQGSHRHSILPSLIQTAKRQGKEIRTFLAKLITSDTQDAHQALYRNPRAP